MSHMFRICFAYYYKWRSDKSRVEGVVISDTELTPVLLIVSQADTAKTFNWSTIMMALSTAAVSTSLLGIRQTLFPQIHVLYCPYKDAWFAFEPYFGFSAARSFAQYYCNTLAEAKSIGNYLLIRTVRKVEL